MTKMEDVQRFITLTELAEAIVESDASWETKYDLIFSKNISGQIRATDISFDWCDPDMGYDDDVLAYVRALREKANDLSKALTENAQKALKKLQDME